MTKRKQAVVIGYEVEFYLPSHLTRINKVRSLLRRYLCGYAPVSNHRNRQADAATCVFVRRDGSLNDRTGYEIVTPPLPQQKAAKLLQRVFQFITLLGGTTTDETGLHVNMSLKSAKANAKLSKDNVALMVVPFERAEAKRWKREDNDYAEPLAREIWVYTSQNGYWQRNFKRTYTWEDAWSRLDTVIGHIENKHITVNLNNYDDGEGYYEFRIIGNWDYHKKFKKIMQSVDRYATLLDKASRLTEKEYVNRYNKVVGIIENWENVA